MKLYNSRFRIVEEFVSLEPGMVKMYSCGPTVYDYAHIGNIRAYVFVDLLKKTLQMDNYAVKHVINITDFGHLVGDSDDGEDKMSEGLKRENLPRTLEGMKTLADKYTKYFIEDLERMNIEMPDVMPRASENIPEYIKIIQGLDEKGFVYKTSDGLYFDTAKDPKYGYMSLLKNSKDSESRIGINSEKKNAADFALWKFSDASGIGFASPYGFGFPGWPACAIRENIVNPIRQFIGWAPIQETPGAGGVKTETAVAGAATTNTVPTTRETVSNSVNPADAFKGNEKLIADSDERLHAAVEGYTKDVPTVSDRDHDKAYVESWEARKAYINNLEKTLADPKTQEAGSAEIGRKLDAARADLKEFEGQFKKGAGSPGGAEELQAMKDSLGEQAAADKKSADDAEAARKRAEQEAADRSRVGGGNGGGGSGGGGANKSIADVLSGLMGGGQNSAECEAAKSQCSANRSTAACQKVAQCQSQSSNPLSQLGQMLGKALGGGGSSGSAAQPGSVAANAACNAYPGTTLTNGQCACQQSGYSFYQAGTTLNGAPVPTSGCYAPSVAAGTNPGGQTPVATISCATNAADVGMTIPVSWSCQNSVTARVDGFTPAAQELAQLSGSSQVTVAKPASGSSVDYTVTCINQGQTDVKKCTVAIGQPGLAIVAIPDRPEVGKTSIIGWYSTGMSSCSIKGGRMKGGTGSPIDEFTKEGTSGSITLPPIEDGDVFEAGLACVSTSGQTTTKGIEIRQKQ
jgi:hypothetical protein